ncbi:MAG: UvrD-helicase domain-containing protein [Prolixibacteraceae bacterium]|nr:UvrD-helicase domain-containing protein [Prolixibacteraceae bacterium]
MLTVYKASAGSGKTFRLVTEYLKLVLQNEFNYKNILAVTFTNKATAEMKERVVSQLYKMANNIEESNYTKVISEELKISRLEIQEKAKKALRNILHDYNRFSISTIDKFTQKVIKSFNRELGLTPGYTLELDNDMLLYEATDRLILNSATDKELLKWLTQLGEERIQNSKGVNIRDEIFKLGKELFSEKFQDFFTGDHQKFYDRNILKNYRKQLQKIIAVFEKEMKIKGEKGLNIIKSGQLDISDFSYGETGVAGAFIKVTKGNFEFGSRIKDGAGDPEKWVKKDHKRRNEIISLINAQLLPILIEILNYSEKNSQNYFTAKLISSNLYSLGVLSDLQKEMDLLRYEKGILPISDSNLLLKRIIDGSDSPFIYEKTGNTYNHFMLDEFQDTSGMQWDNFKPLIDNSMAEGNENLAVGDVKQSIYRWRNSDWRILAQKIEDLFNNQQLKIENLKTNHRSDGTIIKFNNLIFPELKKLVAEKYQSEDEQNENNVSEIIHHIYKEVDQHIGKVESYNNGFAEVSFIIENQELSFKNQTLDLLFEQVKELFKNGYKGSDIAILVRKNTEGSEIIRYFLEASEKEGNSGFNPEIISNESLFLNSSKGVIFVTQVISHLVNPEDKLVKAGILNEYKVFLYPELSKKGKDIVYKTIDEKGQAAFNFAGSGNQVIPWLDTNFESEFDTIFKPLIEILRTNILNSSIDEAITYICKTFNLFDLEEDLPFLQGLIDQSAQIKTNISNDLSNFLLWWDEKGEKLSVNVNDDADAIRILTIHKSKGLEFKAVLIPFFDWSLSWNSPPTLWCKPTVEPFDQLPLVPAKAVDLMKKSIFYNDYFEEKLNSYIDNLNLIYVAFTRAVSVLYVNAQLPEKKNDQVEVFLFDVLEKIASPESWNRKETNTKTVFSLGTLEVNKREAIKIKKEVYLKNYSFFEFNSRLKLRTETDDFFSESGLTDKNLGKLLHEILAGIETAKNVETSCLEAFKMQKINADEYKIMTRWIKELLENPEVKDWFSGNYKVFTERSLLTKDDIKRPDRIMIKNNNGIIVDYKLSHVLPEIYNSQVINYANELKKTGLTEVEGYLWYLVPNKVEKVCII